jgi:parallel beta-helix repeat protein
MHKNRALAGIISLLLIFSFFLVTYNVERGRAAGKDIYVDDDQKYPDDADGTLYNPFYSIQDAIDASQDGDIIKILPGDYSGSIKVSRAVTITTEDMINTRISSGEQKPYLMEITAPSVSIERLSINDFTTTSHRKAVIHISSGANSVKIINNLINHSKVGYGIEIDNADNIIIRNNTINDTRGINVISSSVITIDSNVVSNCTDFPGLRLISSNINRIGNNVIENNDYGIYSDNSDDNIIYNNTITGNINSGIVMNGGNNNEIINNTIYKNGHAGIDLKSYNGIVSDSKIYDNGIGINIIKSGNTITRNIFYDGGFYDIFAESDSKDNLIYNNNLTRKGGSHAKDEGNNQWDDGSIGNYWSDFYGPDPENKNNTVTYNFVNVPNIYKYRKEGVIDNYPKGRYHKQPEILIDTKDYTSPIPRNLAEGESRSPRLSVIVTDPDRAPYTERLDVRFYYILNGTSYLISEDNNVESGGTASVWFSSTIEGKNAVYSYGGLGYDYIGVWYVEVEDSYSRTTSPIWVFSTLNTPVDNDKPEIVIDPPEDYLIDDVVYAQVNDALTFDASNCNDPDGEIIFYRWSFGNEENIVNEISPTYLFKNEGSHIVNLAVIDNNGSSNQSEISVMISSNINRAPSASIGAPSSAYEGDSVAFSSSGSSDPDPNDDITYFWNFGDGSTSEDENPTHKYSKAGRYTLTLTVTDYSGENSSTSIEILIKSKVSDSPGFELILVIISILCILIILKKRKIRR